MSQNQQSTDLPMQFTKLTREELADRFDSLSDKFLEVSRTEKGVVDFSMPCVGKLPECGTVACHGGWGAVVLGEDVKYREFRDWDDLNENSDYFNSATTTSYHDGITLIAEFLGFYGRHFFEDWAKCYGGYWGNSYGRMMFGNLGYSAFTDPGKDHQTIDLYQIQKWYREVAARLRYMGRDLEKLNAAYLTISQIPRSDSNEA